MNHTFDLILQTGLQKALKFTFAAVCSGYGMLYKTETIIALDEVIFNFV